MKKLVSAALAAALAVATPAAASAAQPHNGPASSVPAAFNLSSEIGGPFAAISEGVWEAAMIAFQFVPWELRGIVSQNSSVLSYYHDLDEQNWRDYGDMKSRLTPR